MQQRGFTYFGTDAVRRCPFSERLALDRFFRASVQLSNALIYGDFRLSPMPRLLG